MSFDVLKSFYELFKKIQETYIKIGVHIDELLQKSAKIIYEKSPTHLQIFGKYFLNFVF